MTSIQYTIRSVPPTLDLFFRKEAKRTDQSLNQVLLDYLYVGAKPDIKADEIASNFDWMFGLDTIEEVSLKAIQEQREIDKKKKRICA
jgi:hypothetical protein